MRSRVLSPRRLNLYQHFEEKVFCLGGRAIWKLRAQSGLTNRWSGRVRDKVPSSYTGARAAQLNR